MQNISTFFGILLAVISFVYCKQLTNVFTSLDSISLYKGSGDPYSFYKVQLSWSLTSSQNAQTGDKFTLVMPGVAEVRLTGGSGYLQHFDLTAAGFVVGSCNIDQSAWEKDYTKLDCQITSSEVTKYSSLTGTVSYIVVFIGGGTPELISFGTSYTTGENKISFNDGAGNEISNSVRFLPTNFWSYSSEILSRYTMNGTGWLYIILPQNVCQGQRGIRSAQFTLNIDSSVDDMGAIIQSKTGIFYTDSVNPFFLPKSYSNFDHAMYFEYSEDGKKMDVNIPGSVPENSYIWMTTQYEMSASNNAQFSIKYKMHHIRCKVGSYHDQYKTMTFNVVQGSSGGSGSGDGKYN